MLDWVPAHFPRDEWALARFDGTALYEHDDPRRGAHPDWGTLVFNLARNEVRNFLLANALYWLREYHADGLRVDAVASMLYLDYSRKAGEWMPNELRRPRGPRRDRVPPRAQRGRARARARRDLGRRGVDRVAGRLAADLPRRARLRLQVEHGLDARHAGYFAHDPVYRRYHHHELTFSLIYAFSENFVLPLSHDEVVHGKGSLLSKMPGDRWQQLANLRALVRATCGRTPARSCCSWAASSRRSASGTTTLARLAPAGATPSTRRRRRRSCATSTASTATSRRCYEVDFEPRRLPLARRRTTSARNVVRVRARSARRRARSSASCNLSPVPRERYRVGLPRGGPLARGAQHRLGALRRLERRQLRRRRGGARSRGRASRSRRS